MDRRCSSGSECFPCDCLRFTVVVVTFGREGGGGGEMGEGDGESVERGSRGMVIRRKYG